MGSVTRISIVPSMILYIAVVQVVPKGEPGRATCPASVLPLSFRWQSESTYTLGVQLCDECLAIIPDYLLDGVIRTAIKNGRAIIPP